MQAQISLQYAQALGLLVLYKEKIKFKTLLFKLPYKKESCVIT